MEKLKVSYLHSDYKQNVIREYLEMAETYHNGSVIWVCPKSDKTRHGSMLFHLTQLEEDGYITTEWSDCKTHDGSEALELLQISRTVKGYNLLDKLKVKTPIGSIKKRVIDILWVVITTIITTLIVLAIKGK